MKKVFFLVILIIVSFSVFLSSFFIDFSVLSAVSIQKKRNVPVIIIDAGHGGFDGGAVSKNGIIEKDVNLKISLYLSDALRSFGYKVVLTRESDKSLESNGLKTIREKKTSDILNRFRLADKVGATLFISIHQNSFTSEKYSGMQVFYSPSLSEESAALANYIQSATKNTLQKDNSRAVKECSDSVYLIYNSVIPAVLVECGFLSNTHEAELLSDDLYQRKIALCIAMGVENYFTLR